MQTLTGDQVTDEVLTAAFGIPYPETGASFMNGHATGLLVRRSRLTTRWREHTLVLVDDSGAPVARGTMIPYRSDRQDRRQLPSGGWDEVAIWAAEDAMDGSPPDSLCALEIMVKPERMGEGLSAVVLGAMKDHARARAMSLVAPVRPPDKASKPWQTMQSYVDELRTDRLPADRWLRVHVRAGGHIESIASSSMTISAPLRNWRAWTGLDLLTSGKHPIPGGLVPLIVDTDLGLGVYVEPNVWVRHF